MLLFGVCGLKKGFFRPYLIVILIGLSLFALSCSDAITQDELAKMGPETAIEYCKTNQPVTVKFVVFSAYRNERNGMVLESEGIKWYIPRRTKNKGLIGLECYVKDDQKDKWEKIASKTDLKTFSFPVCTISGHYTGFNEKSYRDQTSPIPGTSYTLVIEDCEVLDY